MYNSGKSHAMSNAGSYYRTSPYTYRGDYYLAPRSTWSKVSVDNTNNTTLKFGSAILILSVLLVLIAVMAIGGLALWMGAFRTDSKNVIVGFSCSFRIARGEKYNPMLKLNTSMVFREKERKFKNIFELLFRRSVLGSSYKQTTIDKFENNTLKVFFRLYLDRRKIPRSITNVEDTIRDIIIKETYAISSLFKNMEIDLKTVSVKRINQEGMITQKQEHQQKHAVIGKNGLLRSNRSGSSTPRQKAKPIIRTDSAEDSGENSSRTAELVTESGTTAIRIAALNEEASNVEERVLPTSEATTAVAKRATVAPNDDTSDGQTTVDAIKTSVSLEGATAPAFDNLDESFLSNSGASPWRPVLSSAGRIDTQFELPHVNEMNRTAESGKTTRKAANSSISDNQKAVTSRCTSTTVDPLSRPGTINIFDTKTTKLPKDERIASDLIASGPADAYKHPDIEVAGQLPSEVFSVKLKASHNDNNRMSSASTHTVVENATMPNEDNPSLNGIELNDTREVGEKFDNLLSTTDDNGELHHNGEIVDKTAPINGVGVAEPVPDSEVELEAKGRYSDILSRYKETLRDRKVNSSRRQQQPIVYTSYITSDLNDGSNFASSLIETPTTTKPFRHTIPVDKVTSVVSLRDPSVSILVDNVPSRSTTNAFQGNQNQALVTENAMVRLPNYEQNTSVESSSLARTSADNKLKRHVSRNSTFIQVGIVEHTPNDSEETSSESYAANSGMTKEDEMQKKIYNDTLKAYVIENSVAPPVGSNTRGISRPRPKIKGTPSVNKTTLLEQLFRVTQLHARQNDTDIKYR